MEGPTVASQSEQLLSPLQQQQQQQLSEEDHAEGLAVTIAVTTPLNNHPQNIFRTPTTCTPTSTPRHQSRQAAWWQSSVVRRSSSAVDEAVDELTEKSQFLLRKSPRTPRTSSSGSMGGSSSSDSLKCCNSAGGDDPLQRLDSPQEVPEVEDAEEEDYEDDNDNDDDSEVLTVAPFYRHEIQVGQLLGEGAFSCVYEVTGFDLVAGDEEGSISPAAQQLRQSIASAPPGRFALKHLKADLLANTKDFEDAATDLVMEAKYLGALKHPNILTLRGLPIDGTAAFANQGEPGHYHDGYFILTDRLTETLAQRIERWKSNPEDATNTVLNKTRFALQIADGISFLHQQRIIFRDLKPSNIGFNADDDSVRLFDFGLVRELPSPKRARPYRPYMERNPNTDGNDELSEYSEYMDESWNEDDDDIDQEEDAISPSQRGEEQVYFMSGAGTQIYMAPEILLQNRYNMKVDVYSWAMTVTEMLLLEKPLPWYPMDEHIQYVAKEGDRPLLEDDLIPDSLRDLLAWAWEGNVAQRCTMDQAREELQDIIVQIETEQEANPHAARMLDWSTRLMEAASCIQSFFRSICQRVRTFFARSSDQEQPKSRDVTFDLTATEATATAATDNVDAVESDPDPTSNDTGVDHDANENSASSLSSASEQHHATFQAGPDDGNHDCNTNSNSSRAARAAMWKRKESSASTTAMTDDECDDDMVVMAGVDHHHVDAL